jgi:hypothetical protein
MRYRLGVGSDGETATWFGGKKAAGSSSIKDPNVAAEVGEEGRVRLVNATFVILARNTDVWEIIGSIRGMEGAAIPSWCIGCHLLW